MELPFKKYIIAQLLRGKSCSNIIDQLNSFGYNVNMGQVQIILEDMQRTLPDNIRELFSNSKSLDSSNDNHIEWMKHYDVYDFIKYLDDTVNKTQNRHMRDTFDNLIWFHNHPAVASLINVLIFNKEPSDSIVAIIDFKFSKKMPINTIDQHKKIMWDTENISAIEALRFCRHFNNNILAITSYGSGCVNEEEDWAKGGILNGIGTESEASNGFSSAVIFQDTDYIKWKIGYKEIKKPDITEFLEEVKTDSYYKYKEAMQMIQNIERSKIEGITPGEDGSPVEINNTNTRYRNVEEQKNKLAKAWVDMYIKAHKSLPESHQDDKVDEFFENLKEQVELDFEENEVSDYLTTIDDAKDILKDIQGEKLDFSYEEEKRIQNESEE